MPAAQILPHLSAGPAKRCLPTRLLQPLRITPSVPGIARFTIVAAAALVVAASSVAAQPAWPGFSDRHLNLAVHDAFHAGTSLGFAEGLRVFELSETKRYLLGTVALPIAQETFDYFYWHRARGVPFRWKEPMLDILTYQGAWALPLYRRKKWVTGTLVLAAWAGLVYVRAYDKQPVAWFLRLSVR